MNIFTDLFTSNNKEYAKSNPIMLFENSFNHQICKDESKSTMVTFMKTVMQDLSSKGYRKQSAIAQLLMVLPQCKPEILTLYGERLIMYCSQCLKYKEFNDLIKEGLIAVIRIVLRRCHSNKELCNLVSKLNGIFISTFFWVDSKYVEDVCLFLLDYFHLFTAQGFQKQKALETKLMQVLNLPLSAETDRKVSLVAKVFVSYPVTDVDSGTILSNEALLNQLMAATHSAIDQLFADVQENETCTFPREHKLFVPVMESVTGENDPIRKLMAAIRLAANLLTFVGGFLEKADVEVSPRELVRLPLRVLQVEMDTLVSSGGLESKVLAFVLPTLHTRALKLLQVLIKSDLCDPFTRFVEEQLVATLKATHQDTSFTRVRTAPKKDSALASNLLVRNLCYETLAQLIQASEGTYRATVDDVVPLLIIDTTPPKDSVELRSVVRGGRLSLLSAKKKSKKKGYTVTSTQEADEARENVTLHRDFCSIPTVAAALKVVEGLFLRAHQILSPEIVRTLQNHLMTLLRERSRKGAFGSPLVRAALYGAAMAYALHPYPLCPPPYVQLHTLLKEGAEEHDPTVSSVCSRGLATLSFIVANPSVANWGDAAWQTTPHQGTRDVNRATHGDVLPEAEENGYEEPCVVGDLGREGNSASNTTNKSRNQESILESPDKMAQDDDSPENCEELQDNNVSTDVQNNVGTDVQNSNVRTDVQNSNVGTDVQNNNAGTEVQNSNAGTEVQNKNIGTEVQNSNGGTEVQNNNAGTEVQNNNAGTEVPEHEQNENGEIDEEEELDVEEEEEKLEEENSIKSELSIEFGDDNLEVTAQRNDNDVTLNLSSCENEKMNENDDEDVMVIEEICYLDDDSPQEITSDTKECRNISSNTKKKEKRTLKTKKNEKMTLKTKKNERMTLNTKDKETITLNTKKDENLTVNNKEMTNVVKESASVKRTMSPEESANTKKLKTDEKNDDKIPSVAEILESFIAADSDSE